jgi:hypothetical protein
VGPRRVDDLLPDHTGFDASFPALRVDDIPFIRCVVMSTAPCPGRTIW